MNFVSKPMLCFIVHFSPISFMFQMSSLGHEGVC